MFIIYLTLHHEAIYNFYLESDKIFVNLAYVHVCFCSDIMYTVI